MLVAFDTIFEQCSVAVLSLSEGKILYQKTIAGGRGQTEIILPMLDEALQTLKLPMNAIKVWAFNRGPGAFSGIRINTAVVQALSVANDAPCVGVSSLEALAFCANNEYHFADGTTIAAVIDARQNQVYAGNFVVQAGQIKPHFCSNQENHEYLADYQNLIKAHVVVGDGVDLVQTVATKYQLKPSATDIARLACAIFNQQGGVKAQNALPVYLRNNAWKTLAEQGKKK